MPARRADPDPAPRQRTGGVRADIVDQLRTYGVESHRLAEVFAETHGVHHTDLRALVAVLHAEQRGQPLTPGDLAAALGLSSGATTAVVDRLERSGHLRRARDHPDRRRVHLYYDPAGLALAQGYFRPVGERTEAVLRQFTDDELATVARFLRAMNDTLAEHRERLGDASPTAPERTRPPEPLQTP